MLKVCIFWISTFQIATSPQHTFIAHACLIHEPLIASLDMLPRKLFTQTLKNHLVNFFPDKFVFIGQWSTWGLETLSIFSIHFHTVFVTNNEEVINYTTEFSDEG